MQHRSINEVQEVANICAPIRRKMTIVERLERWATLLDETSKPRVNTLRETEYRSRAERDAMRSDNSPISVAFADPLLREEGLQGDTYGDAMRFFELSDRELHQVLCYCEYGSTTHPRNSARAVRSIIRSITHPGFLTRLKGHFGFSAEPRCANH